MKRLPLTAGLFISLFLAGACAHDMKKKEDPGAPVVRSADLKRIFDYVSRADPEYNTLRQRIILLKEPSGQLMENLSSDSLSGPDNQNKPVPEQELRRLIEEEQKLKAGIYELINSAVRSCAAKNGIHIIINSTEGVLYAAPEYDVTDAVIIEITALRNRTRPMVR